MSKVIICLKGREVTYLSSESADLASDLKRILKSFIAENDDAQMALRNAEYADKKMPDLVQDVCMQFEEEGFTVYALDLVGFKLNLRKPCKRIQRDLDNLGMAAGAKGAYHRVVAVGGYIIDVCHARMGSNYPADGIIPFDELRTYWSRVTDDTTLRSAMPRPARTLQSIQPTRIRIDLSPDTDQRTKYMTHNHVKTN